jgi:peptidyl-prolyl cis-trans isomerase-like 2
MKGAAKHDARGIVAMANKGAGTNGCVRSILTDFMLLTGSSSQFYLTFKPTPHLDKKHTVFGKLVGGEDILDALEKLPLKDGTERPLKPVRITQVVMYVAGHSTAMMILTLAFSFQDPFEDYKARLTKKLARKAEAEQNAKTQIVPEKKGDDVNWFGMKVGTGNAAIETGRTGGVGKYLNLKRPMEGTTVGGPRDEGKKKRKIGFGDFEGW